MTYCEHMKFAFFHGLSCLKAGLFLVLHSIVPAFFPMAGSKLVNRLNKSFTEHNNYLLLKEKVEALKND